MGDLVKLPDGTEVVMPDNPSPEFIAEFSAAVAKMKRTEPLKEAGRVVDKSVRAGAAATPGLIGDSMTAVMRNLRTETPHPGITLLGMADRFIDPDKKAPWHKLQFGDVTNAIATAGGTVPLSQPKTETGKALANVGESGVAAALGGGGKTIMEGLTTNLGQRAFVGASGGAGGEAAARYFGDNAFSRILGSLVGAGAGGYASSFKANSTERIQDATSQLRDRDWTQAEAFKKILDALGLKSLNSQLLGPRGTADDLLFHASANPTVRSKIESHMADVSKQTQKQHGILSQTMPVSIGKMSAMSDVQDAAASRLGKLRENSNTAFEAAMPPTDLTYSQTHVKNLYDEMIALANSAKFGETSKGGEALKHFASRLRNPNFEKEKEAALASADPLTAMASVKEFVDNAHKLNNLIKGDTLKAIKKEGWEGLPEKDIKRLVKSATQEFDPAREAKHKYMVDHYNPEAKSLIGKIAQQGGGTKQDKLTATESPLSWAFNSGQKDYEITQMGKAVGGEPVGIMLREHISKVMRDSWGKGNHQANYPGQFYEALYGQPWQKKNVDTAMRVYLESTSMPKAEVEETIKGFGRMLRALDTYKDVKIAPGISGTQLHEGTSKGFLRTLIAPIRATFVGLGAKANDQTFQEIAEIMMKPDGLKIMKELAKAPGPERMKAAAISILSQTQEGSRNAGGLFQDKPAGVE